MKARYWPCLSVKLGVTESTPHRLIQLRLESQGGPDEYSLPRRSDGRGARATEADAERRQKCGQETESAANRVGRRSRRQRRGNRADHRGERVDDLSHQAPFRRMQS